MGLYYSPQPPHIGAAQPLEPRKLAPPSGPLPSDPPFMRRFAVEIYSAWIPGPPLPQRAALGVPVSGVVVSSNPPFVRFPFEIHRAWIAAPPLPQVADLLAPPSGPLPSNPPFMRRFPSEIYSGWIPPPPLPLRSPLRVPPTAAAPSNPPFMRRFPSEIYSGWIPPSPLLPVLRRLVVPQSSGVAAPTTLDTLLAEQTAALVFTAENSPWSIPAQAVSTFYVGTREFATAPTDALANTRFAGVLAVPLNFRRSILGSDAIGVFTSGDGSLEFSNSDGSFDYLIGDYTIDGREIVVKVGRITDSYDNYQVIFKGTAADWFIDDASVKIVLRDYAYKLKVAAQPNVYSGAGGSNGGADLTGKRKPRALGFVQNVSPPLVEPASLIYQVNDGIYNSISHVYDRGVGLTADADYATYAALKAAVIPAGSFATCLALGYLRLSSTPTGTVTADLFGDANGGYVDTISNIIRRLISTSTTLVDPTDLYVASFTLLASLQPLGNVGYWIGPDSTETVADVIANLMNGVGGWGGFRRDGLFEVAIFSAPSGAAAAAYTYRDGKVIDVKREPLPPGLSPPPYRWRVGYNKNYTVQTDLAAGAGTTRISFAAQDVRISTATDLSVQTNYLFAQDPPPVMSYLPNATAATAEAARRLALYGTKRALYRVKLNWSGLARNIGEFINLTWPRWDLSSGKQLTIVEINDDCENNTVELVCYG